MQSYKFTFKQLLLPFVILSAIALLIAYFRLPDKRNEVVVYVAHDQDYAQPVLEEFEKKTGIKVKAVYDTEASKTVGLTNRLIAEKFNPIADVFWNNEVIHSIKLKNEALLAEYKPLNYGKIPDKFKDPDGYWTGFAARARVLLINTDLLADKVIPDSIEELYKSMYQDNVTIADPRFGTTGSHIAALFALWGGKKTQLYFKNLDVNGLDIAQSNGQTRDKVVSGEKLIGFTDSDDAYDALVKKKPVEMIYPDQGKKQIGTLIIPNTVMIIKGGKNRKNAEKLIDYLVSVKTESDLAYAKSAQIPLLPNVKYPSNVRIVDDIKTMDVTWDKIYENYKPALEFMEENFLD